MTIDNVFILAVLDKIKEAVNGSGIYGRNRACRKIKDTLYNQYNIHQQELINEIFCFILDKKLLDKYEEGKSLGWFIAGISWRWLTWRLRKENTLRKREQKLLDDINREIKERTFRLPEYYNPEKLLIMKQQTELINSITTEAERHLITGEISIGEFAKDHGMEYDAVAKHKKRLTCKCKLLLEKNGYDKLF
jgi:hypothetical protein